MQKNWVVYSDTSERKGADRMKTLATEKSRELYAKAVALMPGGVNSPVRAFKAVGGDPVYIEKAKGSRVWDVDGNEYIDYLASWGPMILGHADADVNEAIRNALDRGTSYGAPHPAEIEMAALIKEAFPSMDLARMVNSGTEATMSAIRAARGYTGRKKVVKFEGCYHGHSDQLLAKAGSGAMTLGIPDSMGVPEEVTAHTIILPYNDIKAADEVLRAWGDSIACVIVEPVAGNMGVIPPVPGFLEMLRKLTEEMGIALIFDEVITGFRVAYGGAQELYGIRGDMTCLGKIIGGGLPVGAYGGRKEIMECIAPVGYVYQAGTLSGNPLALAAGIAALKKIKSLPDFYKVLEKRTAGLMGRIGDVLKRHGIPHVTNRVGSMFTSFFTASPVTDYVSAKTADTGLYRRWFRELLSRGVYVAPSQFEAGFVSWAHTEEDMEETACTVENLAGSLVKA
jgi:glutamate-1-semialdehyde 2,1-aminomutase